MKANHSLIAVLETLKKHNCISGYTIAEQDVIPEWKEGGINRAVHELTINPKPFGLNKSQRAALLLVLPREAAKEVIDDVVRSMGLPVD